MIGFDKFLLSLFIGVALFATSLFFLPIINIDPRWGKEMIFLFFSIPICVVFSSGFNKEKFCYALIIMYSFITLEKLNLNYCFYYFIMFSSFMLLSSTIEGILDETIIKKFFLYICMISCIWVVLDYLNIDFCKYVYKIFNGQDIRMAKLIGGKYVIDNSGIKDIAGPIIQASLSGALISFTGIVLFEKEYRYLIPVCLTGLYLCKSSMAWGTYLASFLIYLFINIKQKISVKIIVSLSLITIFIIFICLFPGFFTQGERFECYKRIISDYPFHLFGLGLGYMQNHPIKLIETFRQPHSELISLYLYFGIPGCIWFLYMIKRIKNFRSIFFVIFCATIINSLLNITFHIAALAFISIISYSFILKANNQRNDNGTINSKTTNSHIG